MQDNDILLKIKQCLTDRKWTIYKLAKESHIPYSSLNNIFLRNTEPTLSTLRKICDGFGITMSEFFSDNTFMLQTEYTAEEKELIELYQSLKRPEKKLLMIYANGLAKQIPD